MLAEMPLHERRVCVAPLGIARTSLLGRVLPSGLKSGLFSPCEERGPKGVNRYTAFGLFSFA